MPRSLMQKMGLKDSTRTIFINAPSDALAAIDPANLKVAADLTGQFDYVHIFVHRQTELDETFPTLKPHVTPTGMLWVSWPKGRQLGTDLTIKQVISIGYRHGLVESTCVRINATWSALKFIHPKPGKVYHNSFGQLPA